MKDPKQLIPLTTKNLQSYVRAARRLKRLLGGQAPSVRDLVEFELTGRNPRDIVAAYLDHVRDQRRRRDVQLERASGGPSPRDRVPLVKEATWPIRRQALATGDPARN